MISKVKLLFTIMLMLNFFSAFTQKKVMNLYVDAQNGNDSNAGKTLTLPFKSINKAKDAVRNIEKTKYSRIVVNLRAGIYQLSKTLLFTEYDGGNEHCKIIYKNYNDEVVVFSGGLPIMGWELYSKEQNIYRTVFDTLNIRQLYVNGKRAIRARQPNKGITGKIMGYDKANKIMKFNKSDVSEWNNLKKVEIVTVNQFTTNHLRIESINSESEYSSVTLQDPEATVLSKLPEPFSWKYYWFENAREFIDTEGEWYQDNSAGYLYYKPFSTEDMNSVRVWIPYLETLLKIEGSNLDNPVTNLDFEGIAFKYTTWLWPNKNGCVEFQAFHPFCNNQLDSGGELNFYAPAGVYVAKADFIKFERCSFMHMGANGLQLHDGTHHCNIIGNVVYDISGNGIYEMMQNYPCTQSTVKYQPVDSREVCSFDNISNNYISNCGADYEGAVGIFCGFTKNVTISHNEICNLPYTAISVGWGWGELNDKTVMEGNEITANYIHDVNMDTIMYDGGAIYTLGDQPNSNCKGNYCISRCRGLFFDEGTGHYTVTNNVVDAGLEWIAIWNPKQHNILADGNFSKTKVEDNRGTNCMIKNTEIVPSGKWPSKAKKIIREAGIEKKYAGIKKHSL